MPTPWIDATIHAFPASPTVWHCSGAPWTIVLQPLAPLLSTTLPRIHVQELAQCKDCGAYINCFVRFFSDNRWVCSICSYINPPYARLPAHQPDASPESLCQELMSNVYEAELHAGPGAMRTIEVLAYIDHVRDAFVTWQPDGDATVRRPFRAPELGLLPKAAPLQLSQALELSLRYIRGQVLQSLLHNKGAQFSRYLSGLVSGGPVAPPAYVLLVDASTFEVSRTETKFERIKQAVLNFLRSAPSNVWVALIAFSTRMDVYNLHSSESYVPSYVSLTLNDAHEDTAVYYPTSSDSVSFGSLYDMISAWGDGEKSSQVDILDRLFAPLSRCREAAIRAVSSLKPHRFKTASPFASETHVFTHSKRAFGSCLEELLMCFRRSTYLKSFHVQIKAFLTGAPNSGWGALPDRERLVLRMLSRVQDLSTSGVSLATMSRLMAPNLEQRLKSAHAKRLNSWKPKVPERELLANVLARMRGDDLDGDTSAVAIDAGSAVGVRAGLWSSVTGLFSSLKTALVKRMVGSVPPESDSRAHEPLFVDAIDGIVESQLVAESDLEEMDELTSYGVDDIRVCEEMRRLSLDCQVDLRISRIARTQPSVMAHLLVRQSEKQSSSDDEDSSRFYGSYFAYLGLLAVDTNAVVDLYLIAGSDKPDVRSKQVDEANKAEACELVNFLATQQNEYDSDESDGNEDSNEASTKRRQSTSASRGMKTDKEITSVDPERVEDGLSFTLTPFDCASLGVVSTLTCGTIRRIVVSEDEEPENTATQVPEQEAKLGSQRTEGARGGEELDLPDDMSLSLQREVQAVKSNEVASRCLLRVRVPKSLTVRRIRGPVLPDAIDGSLLHAPALHASAAVSLDVEFSDLDELQPLASRSPSAYRIQSSLAYTALESVPTPESLLARLERVVSRLNQEPLNALATPALRDQRFMHLMTQEKNNDYSTRPLSELEHYVPIRKLRIVTAQFPRTSDIGTILRSVQPEFVLAALARALASHSFVHVAVLAQAIAMHHNSKSSLGRHPTDIASLISGAGGGFESLKSSFSLLRKRLPPLALPAKFRTLGKPNETHDEASSRATTSRPDDPDNVAIDLSFAPETLPASASDSSSEDEDEDEELSISTWDDVTEKNNPIAKSREAAEDWLLQLLVMYNEQLLGVSKRRGSHRQTPIEAEFESLKTAQLGIIPRLVHAILQHPAFSAGEIASDTRFLAHQSIMNGPPKLLTAGVYPHLVAFGSPNEVIETSVGLSLSAVLNTQGRYLLVAIPGRPLILNLSLDQGTPLLKTSKIYAFALPYYLEGIDTWSFGGGFSTGTALISKPIVLRLNGSPDQQASVLRLLKACLVEDGAPQSRTVSYPEFIDSVLSQLHKILLG